MSKFDNDNEIFSKGIKQLLGQENYDPAEVIKECKHQSDGLIYDDELNPIETTLCCKLCGLHYTVPSTTIDFDMFKKINNR